MSTESATRTMTIGGREVTLARPASYTLRTEVWLLAGSNRIRALAAALGMCWRGVHRPKVSYEACGFTPAVYGQRVLDELVGEREVPLSEVLSAGGAALELMVGGLVSEPEVKEAEGNSEAAEEGSTV